MPKSTSQKSRSSRPLSVPEPEEYAQFGELIRDLKARKKRVFLVQARRNYLDLRKGVVFFAILLDDGNVKVHGKDFKQDRLAKYFALYNKDGMSRSISNLEKKLKAVLGEPKC